MLDKIGREGLGIFLIRPFMCKKAVERITIRAQGCSVGCQTLFTQILGTHVKYGIAKSELGIRCVKWKIKQLWCEVVLFREWANTKAFACSEYCG